MARITNLSISQIWLLDKNTLNIDDIYIPTDLNEIDTVLRVNENLIIVDTELTPTDYDGTGALITIPVTKEKSNTITVSSSGGNFTSIKAAVDSITDSSGTNRYNIKVYAGTYNEDPMVIPPFVMIDGSNSRVIPNSEVLNLFKITDGGILKNLRIKAPTSAIGVYINTTSVTLPELDELIFYGGNIGILAEGVGTEILVEECRTTSDVTTLLIAKNGAKVVAFNLLGLSENFMISDAGLILAKGCGADGCINGLIVDNGGAIQVSAMELFNVTNCLTTEVNGGYILGSGINCLGLRTIDILQKSGSGIIRLSTSLMTIEKLSIVDWTKISLDFNSDDPGDEGLNVIKELHVGTPEVGKEAVFGGGDSYSRGILIYNYEPTGSLYTNITSDGVSTVNNITFSSNTIDSAIYVCSSLYNATDKLCHLGHKITTIVNSVGATGDILLEYWNGVNWVSFNSMVTNAIEPYLPRGKELFERTGSHQIRFSSSILDDWVKNDPMGLGEIYYWVRYRVVNVLTTLPTLGNFKVHSNRTEINGDGWVEFFGKARAIARIGWDYGLAEAGINSPSNQDLYVSDSIMVGRVENRFKNGAHDRQGFNVRLPYDCDTSCPVNMVSSMIGSSNTSGVVRFVIKSAYTADGEKVYRNTNNTPNVAVNELSYDWIATIPGGYAEKQMSGEVKLDISNLLARKENGFGDILWVSFERDASHPSDTYPGDVSIINIDGHYTKWCGGGHK